MIDIVHIFLFVFMIAVAVVIIRLKDLFAAVMLTGIFSLLSASLFTVMDAVDVAFGGRRIHRGFGGGRHLNHSDARHPGTDLE